MSRRKQTNPRAIKRDVSQDEDDNAIPTAKKLATESIRSGSIDSSVTTEEEQKCSPIKCDSCQEGFLTSEQFNQHRLYQCSFLPEDNASDESRTSSSFDEYAQQVDAIPFGTSQTEEYPHGCSYCQKSFSNMALLLKHEQIHVELMPFRCSFCGKGFKHRRSLNRHSKLHTGERKFKCTLCESTFARSDHLKAHVRTHNNNNSINPNSISIDKTIHVDFQLKIPFQSKTEFEERRVSSEHKPAKDDNRTEHCPYCPRICLGENSLRLHLQTEHTQVLEDRSRESRGSQSPPVSDTYCYLCNAKFNTRENYLAHMRGTHPTARTKKSESIAPFVNPSTKSQIFSSQSPDTNLLHEYALIEKSIWCEKCKRAFDSTAMYLQHYSFQHCLQIIKCLQCQEVFETIEGFFGHIEKAHPSKTVETLKCKLCNATYKHRPDFLHHVQSVHKLHSSSSHACSLCPAQFDTNSELVDHLTYTHKVTANHPRHPSFNALFTCNFCSLKLSSRFELNHHLLQEHDDERQDSKSDEHPNDKKSSNFSSSEVPCPRCDLTFSNESQLSEHQKHAHPSPPPVPSAPPSFKCSYCHTSFTSRTQLDRHSRIHIAASGNNLKCNICDRLFTSIDILSEHKLSHCKATTSNICSYCHQTLHNEADYTRHLYEHNHQSKSKTKLFTGHQDTTPLTIACIVCKQSLINEREIDLHAKFHLTSPLNKTLPTRPVDSSPLTVACHGCRRSSTTNREFFIELPSFTVHCFQCLAKGLDPSDSHPVSEINGTSNSLSCPKCRTDVQFDSIKTYQQHFASVHLTSNVTEEYHCLKCNKIVMLREHIYQHLSVQSSTSSGFLIDSVPPTRCPSPPRVHYCYLCRTNFDTAIKMHIHLIEHQYPNHDYQCNLCDNVRFDDASQLYHHMVQHGSKTRLYPCRECDVFFMFSMHLINHQHSHTDETVLTSSSLSASKSNGSTKGLRLTTKSKSVLSHDDHKRSHDEDDATCKPMLTRSSSKGTNRSVTVN